MPAPPGSDPTITFLSGVTSDATVAPISFGSWFVQNPPPLPPNITYDPINSLTTKWGDPRLLPFGNPGGNVTYAFDAGYDAVAQDQARSALALWSAEVNISFTQVMDPNAADFMFLSQNR